MTGKRLLPLGGIVFVVTVLFLVIAVTGSSPDAEASGEKYLSFYGAHENREIAVSFLLAAVVPFLVFFGVSLATAGQSASRSFWEIVLVVGTGMTAAAWLLAALLHFSLADAAGHGFSADAIRVLGMLDSNFWMAMNGAFGVMMLGAAGTLLARGSGRLGWPALVLGIALFVPFADFFALLLTALWICVASVVLSRGAGEPASAVARREAIANA